MSGLPGSSPGPNGPGEGYLREQTSPGRLGLVSPVRQSVYKRETRITKPMPNGERPYARKQHLPESLHCQIQKGLHSSFEIELEGENRTAEPQQRWQQTLETNKSHEQRGHEVSPCHDKKKTKR